MTTLYNLRNDSIGYKGRIMANFETLQSGPNVLSTAQRLALSPTIGTVCYDSSMTSMFQYNGNAWVQVG